jgi:asparagine synthase (glutamine-hydrolysing)
MCGITGVFNFSKRGVNETALKSMCESISHRGPDGDGLYVDQDRGVGLGHRRLSIIDLTLGHQPMANANESIWIVFNGEIYNYLDLKKELQKDGFSFKTTSDTEVIIYLYQKYGEKGFARLNGIFSIGIYDKAKNCLVLARDHFGVKPMYYAFTSSGIVFGSEVKTILKQGEISPELDLGALDTFLTFRYNPSPQTLFKGIHKLYPGHYLKINADGKTERAAFYTNKPKQNAGISQTEAVEKYQFLLEQSVKRQMMSDVPVGLLLSGGVDSAVIAYLMQGTSNEKIKTFTIGFEGKGDFNELDDARETANLIGTDHYETTITQKEYLDFFYKSFYYTEEPIAEMTIPALYYVSKLAARHVKVALAGQGADEPLAGYKRYFGEQQINKYFHLLNALPMQQLASLLPRNERIKRAAYASRFANDLDRFLAIYTIFTPEQKTSLLRDDIKSLALGDNRTLVKRLFDETGGLPDSLSKILYIDTRMSLSDNLLLFGDKMSMANSIEMRVPFLDVELIEFIETLPPKLKLRDRTHKFIHKEAVKKWLPDRIIYRKKRGFATPMDQWLQNDFSNVARELFNDPASASRRYFNLGYINTMLDQHQKKKENYQRNIFALLSFEIWHKSFFEAMRDN